MDINENMGHGDARNESMNSESTMSNLKDEASEKLAQAKDKVSEMGRKAGDKLEDGRQKAAGAFASTASTLHEKGDRMAAATSTAAHATADKIQVAADYLRDHNAQAMLEDVSGVVRRYPGQALAAAAVVGFMVGRILKGGD
jgi:ElaB/YqjD/DUF883 family membrane-anchored ribosome-binding protein